MKTEFQMIHGNEWETPSDLFKRFNSEFDFHYDLACSEYNKKCINGIIFPYHQDSLKIKWHNLSDKWLWLNPPYSPIKPWIQKVQKENKLGAKIVVLCPPIISTRYFSEHPPNEIRFILGRISFLKDKIPFKGNTKDSCLLIFDNKNLGQNVKISWIERDL